jgi:hypothetical protein
MRPKLLPAVAAVLLAAAVGLGSAAAQASSKPATIKPAAGGPHTIFTVTFRTPDPPGHSGLFETSYLLSASGGSAAPGCVTDVSRSFAKSVPHGRITTALDPRRLGDPWCLGTFRGRVQEQRGPYCPQHMLCAEFATQVKTIGRFSFSVTQPTAGIHVPAPPGTVITTATTTTPASTAPTTTTPTTPQDTTPPTFAGITSAFACTPGPQRPGQTTPFTLTWTAATDGVTPSGQIVYDVYVATSPGAEDFSKPTYTTPPGITSYRTPGLPSHGTFYFVVRAKDLAGNEDRNTVEARGADPCV